MECKVGVVKALEAGRAVVLVERHSACSGCHAKGFCSSSDRKEEELSIADYPIGLQVGERVRVIPVEGGAPLRAVLIVFVVPLLLMAIGAIVMNVMGLGEPMMLALLLGGLVLYGLILTRFRGYFERKFRLRIERLD